MLDIGALFIRQPSMVSASFDAFLLQGVSCLVAVFSRKAVYDAAFVLALGRLQQFQQLVDRLWHFLDHSILQIRSIETR